MVLSRKKLKQKLRSIVADCLSANEANSGKDASGAAESNQELQRVRELLVTKSRRKKPKKRGEGGEKTALEVAGEGNVELVKSNEDDGSLKQMGKQMRKKRRRGNEDDGVQESEMGSQNEEKTKSKEQKKDKQKKKKEKRKESELVGEGKENVVQQVEKTNDDGKESASTEAKRTEVTQPVQIDGSEGKKVYAGGIPYYSSEDDIRSFFEGCGTITEVDCMRFPETGKFRGIAILTFKTEAAAKRALALDGADMGGFYLKIQPYKATRTTKEDFAPEIIDGYNRIYVGNLCWDVSKDDLKQLFADCNISSIRFGTDKDTGEFKGYAHVDFLDSASLSVALKLDQTVMLGRSVRIRVAVPRKGGERAADQNSGKDKMNKGIEGTNKESWEGDVSYDDGKMMMKKKKKRQTCYECGIPGHISSDCPRRRAGADVPPSH
ncbi:hypothetical protein HPP92_006599 [Vanilla planifolia]|uniref:Uncharacterized protein n=1 Tax=Vanilla planifolia TaxID=51239 RepID=A0A835RK70_VANPL|nr:hypothetical protein HPP92_006599 [Vanilla planifolia]